MTIIKIQRLNFSQYKIWRMKQIVIFLQITNIKNNRRYALKPEIKVYLFREISTNQKISKYGIQSFLFGKHNARRVFYTSII